MRIKLLVIGGLALVSALLATTSRGQERAFEMTPAIQAELDRNKEGIAEWAGDPVIVKAVVEQNAKGPIPGMDKAKWTTIRSGALIIKDFKSNPAGKLLRAKLEKGGNMYTEAFLSATKGEKVAFVEKTTNYIHRGMAKFDVPFDTGKSWQGKPEFDDSSQYHAIQISVPVVSQGSRIGVLVVGLNLTHLERTTSQAVAGAAKR